MSAATNYAAYQAAVAGATGEIVDIPAIHAINTQFIADLMDYGLYADTALAIIGSGGTKNIVTPASGQKVYSMGPTFFANDANGAGNFVTYSSGSYLKPSLIFSGAGATAYLEWNSFALSDGDRLSVIFLAPKTTQNTAEGMHLRLTVGSDIYVFETGAAHYAKSVSGSVVEPEVEMRPEWNLNTYVPFVASFHLDIAQRKVLATLNGNTLDGVWVKGGNTNVTEKVSKLYHAAQVPANPTTGTLKLYGNTTDEPLTELVIVNGNHSLDDAMAFAATRKTRYVA